MNCLEQALSKKSFQLPLLLHGKDASFLEKEALFAAQKVLSFSGETHPDLLLLRPEAKSHTFVFGTLKEELQNLSISPYQSDYKVVILLEVEKMLPIHVTALLKTLEEKPPYVIFFLTTTNLEMILPTILSRSIELFLDSKVVVKEEVKKLVLSVLKASIEKDYSRFYKLIEELSAVVEKEDDLEDVLAWMLSFFRDVEMAKKAPKVPLFFEEEREFLKALPSSSYAQLLEKLVTAESAFRLHTKTKSILENLFL
ncbi:MAG: hypothetical protein JSR76_08150 [Verrucomicrobia bacterium]|nr:hypothetical protein [Verrucomicrobiota bacterium]